MERMGSRKRNLRRRRGAAGRIACAAVVLLCVPASRAQDTDERLSRARAFMQAGRLDRAEKEIRRAAEEAPGSAAVLRALCDLHLVQNDREGSLRECRRAADAAPERVEILLIVADLLAQRDESIDEAMIVYRTASQRDPANPRPHLAMGSLYERRARLREAEAEYREALSINPNLVQANAGLGAVLFIQDRLPEARGYLSRAIELRPRDLRSHVFLGLSLNHDGQLDLALLELRTAATTDPHSANAAAGVAEQRPRFERLRGIFLLQIERNPQDASAWHNVAILAYFLRDYEDSWRHLLRASQLGYPVDLGFKEVVYARWKRSTDSIRQS